MALISHSVKDRWVGLIRSSSYGVTGTPSRAEGKTGVHACELPVARGRWRISELLKESRHQRPYCGTRDGEIPRVRKQRIITWGGIDHGGEKYEDKRRSEIHPF